MVDREKVVRGLEAHANFIRACTTNDGAECPYYNDDASNFFTCSTLLSIDALALLKEQEPKLVVETTSTIRCPGCGKQITSRGAIHREIKYCWKCGQAVKWDGRPCEGDTSSETVHL